MDMTPSELAEAARDLIGDEDFRIMAAPGLEDFAQHYASTKNALEAYAKSGLWSEGTSEVEAKAEARKLVATPACKERIAYYRSLMAAMAHISLANIVTQLTTAASFDIADMYDDEGHVLPVSRIPEEVRRCITGIKVTELGGDMSRTEFKLMDRNKALDSLIRLDSLEKGTATPTIVIGIQPNAEQPGRVFDVTTAPQPTPLNSEPHEQ